MLGVLLLRANEVVSSDWLIEQLWGEQPPPTAAKLVQVYVLHLRKALAVAGGEPVLRTRAPGFVMVLESEQLDATRFTTLLARARGLVEAGKPGPAAVAYAEALAVWRGPVLVDLALEADARVEAERLAGLRLAALGERVDCLGRRGRRRNCRSHPPYGLRRPRGDRAGLDRGRRSSQERPRRGHPSAHEDRGVGVRRRRSVGRHGA